MRIRHVFFRCAVALGFLAVAAPALPCSLLFPVPSAAMLVDRADVIVRVRATGSSGAPGLPGAMAGSTTQVDFEVLQTIKGALTATSIHFKGALVAHDDRNDRPVPYDFVRPGGRSGNCFALTYRQGAEYLMLLKRGQNPARPNSADLDPYWAPLGPTNEQLFNGAADKWLTWVAESLEVMAPANELVQVLREFPAAIPAGGRSTPSPLELRRLNVYDRLWSIGSAALPALCRGLADSDVQVRRNVALFLGAASGDWYERARPRLSIGDCAVALVRALDDTDGRVRELAAQAVPAVGANVAAVPALVRLLGSASEGDRNSACIALAGIGPAASAALPALRKALTDPSADVRTFAKRAIERIER